MANQPEKRRRSREETARLICLKCEAFMDPVPMLPGLGHLAGRIFECGRCRHIHVIPDA
jgi:hypothetical protein